MTNIRLNGCRYMRFFQAGLLALSLQSMSSGVLAEVPEIETWYIGGGLGLTELDPAVGGTGYSIIDERDSGFKLFAGVDLGERVAIEAFYAYLGSAKIGNHVILPDSRVDYSSIGASALYYAWRSGEGAGEDVRKGLQLFLHGGLSVLDTSTDAAYEQDNNVQIQYGAGLEYGLDDGYAVRLAFDLYDVDAGMAYVSILKRFGSSPGRTAIEDVAEPVETVTPEAVELQVPVPVITYDTDSDADGVFDRADQCMDSPPGITVDESGCSVIAVDLKGVNFEKNSYRLTKDSEQILDVAVDMIMANPALQNIEVQAHTDSKGSEKYNLRLSEQRAASVRDYLVSRGVAAERLTAKGYGESQPIADNDTEEGRASNRRVELRVMTDAKE